MINGMKEYNIVAARGQITILDILVIIQNIDENNFVFSPFYALWAVAILQKLIIRPLIT